MKITVGTQKAQIHTDNPKLLKALQRLYSFKVPGASYTSAYKRRGWDPPKTEVPNMEHISSMKYYDYQENLIHNALLLRRGVIKSPTGSGKTLIMAGLIKSLGNKKMVILFNSKQLLKQSYDFVKDVCGIDNVGICSGEGYIYGDIMMSTVQSIEKILDTHLEAAEALMVDECHEFCSGQRTLAAIESFPNASYRFGFTATVPGEPIKRHNLEGALGSIIHAVSTQELVAKGKLTKPIIQIIERDYLANGEDEHLSYIDAYDKYIVYNDERNDRIENITKGIIEQNGRPRILILTKSLDHGRLLEARFNRMQCEFLEGANSVGERYKSISRFLAHEQGSILIGTRILQTGINISEITHLINARGMKSEIATIQALGRALRTSDNKDQVFVYDFKDKEKYLASHSKERIKHYKKEGHEVKII
jgi:superfamily II DNA or RNA helicase